MNDLEVDIEEEHFEKMVLDVATSLLNKKKIAGFLRKHKV
jgi:prophage maintenance system killer protein